MSSNSTYNFVLGSASPRRKELISHLDIPFTIETSFAEEVSNSIEPKKFCEDIAKLKGEDVWSKKTRERELLVSSDTIVCIHDEILGKPKDREEAKVMLLKLSGETHKVITSVFIKTKKKEKVFSVESLVTFDTIDDETLELYLDSSDSLDKAGAYGIQGKGLSFINHLAGSYSNVVGFPLSDFVRELKEFLDVDPNGSWRDYFV